jgi:pimeloyl-ACP methyl ester carboxylesterase
MLPPCSFTLPDNRAAFRIEGRGRPIVVLHHATEDVGLGHSLVERMRGSYRLIAIDLHSGGAMPAASDALDDVALVEGVLRVGLLPGERFHLVGLGHGATVAFELSQRRPQRLHSLLLFENVEADRAVAVSRLVDRMIRGADALELPLPSRMALHG